MESLIDDDGNDNDNDNDNDNARTPWYDWLNEGFYNIIVRGALK